MTERLMEADVGLPSRGEIEGIGIKSKVFGGSTTWRGERPLPRGKWVYCIRKVLSTAFTNAFDPASSAPAQVQVECYQALVQSPDIPLEHVCLHIPRLL